MIASLKQNITMLRGIGIFQRQSVKMNSPHEICKINSFIVGFTMSIRAENNDDNNKNIKIGR
jgi:hypothetical protein